MKSPLRSAEFIPHHIAPPRATECFYDIKRSGDLLRNECRAPWRSHPEDFDLVGVFGAEGLGFLWLHDHEGGGEGVR